MSKKINDLVLTELRRFTYEEVLKSSASEKVATLCVSATIKCMASCFKGRRIYIPTVNWNEIEKKRNNVISEFNGTNHPELAIKYKRSLQWVYSVLKTKGLSKPQRAVLMEVLNDYLPEEFYRLGVEQEEAKAMAKSIAQHLQNTFPGISFYINGDACK